MAVFGPELAATAGAPRLGEAAVELATGVVVQQ